MSENGFSSVEKKSYPKLTLNTFESKLILGSLINETMTLNSLGLMVERTWLSLPERYREVGLDRYQIMPNHFHGLLILHEPTYQDKTYNLGTIVGSFKSLTTRAYQQTHPGEKLWHANYYEHVIRNEKALVSIREYIVNNPLKSYIRAFSPEDE